MSARLISQNIISTNIFTIGLNDFWFTKYEGLMFTYIFCNSSHQQGIITITGSSLW